MFVRPDETVFEPFNHSEHKLPFVSLIDCTHIFIRLMNKPSKTSVQAIFTICASTLLIFAISCDSQLPLNSLQSNITHPSGVKTDVVVEPDPGSAVTEN